MKDKERREREELQEVIRGEKRRGASRAAISLQKDRQLVRDLEDLLRIGDEREYIQALAQRFGITESSPRFSHALRIWREQHGGGQRVR